MKSIEATATTTEMSRSMTQAAASSGRISGVLDEVLEAAKGTNQGARDTAQAALELTRSADSLSQIVRELQG